MDKNEKQELTNPRENASLISIATFAWLYKIFRLGSTRKLEMSDVFSVLQEQSSDVIGPRVLRMWQKENVTTKAKDQRKCPSLLKVLAKTFKKDCLRIACVLIFSKVVLKLIEPFLLMKVLRFFNEKEGSINPKVYYWTLGLMIVKILTSVTYHLNCIHSSHLGLKVKVASSCLIYRKILSLSKSSLENGTSVGQIVNIISDDVRILEQLVFYIFYIILIPTQIICFVLVIYWQMGLAPILSYLFSMIIIPVQGYLGKWISVKIQKCASLTDKRLSLMSEIINGIQVIKMYAWEKPFSSLVDKTRAKEMKVIKGMSIVQMLVKNVRMCIIQLSLFMMVVCSIAFGTNISAEKVYMMASIYTEVRVSVYMMLAASLELLAKGIVAARRIEAFLNCQEKESHPSNFFDQSYKTLNPIRISDVSAKWTSASKEDTIKNMTLSLNSGTLTAIIGQVGSGKSSLLQIILGELPILGGDIQVFGKISYAGQEPWVFASTIKQNILFGQIMDLERYKRVIKVCQLEQDIAAFPFGDGTLIGERGMKLSGGQRARLNLARSVYSEADIYIFDDPLSAVDAEVGKRIFEDCICGFLKDKTRILVTHQLQFLKRVDRILMLKNGSLQAEDTAEEVLKSDIDFLKILNVEKPENVEKDIDDINEKLKLIQNEAEEQKEVSELKTVKKDSKGVFWSYFKAVESLWLVILMVFLGLLYQSILTSADYILSRWMNVEDSFSRRTMNGSLVVTEEFKIQREWYIQMCCISYVAVIVLLFIYTLAFNQVVMRSSERLHQSMFYSVIHATMLFFQENSSGRILNRFSKDISTIDKLLPDCLLNAIAIGLSFLAVLSLTIIIRPWSFIFILILGVILYFLCTTYMRTIHSVKHLEAISRSPVFGHVNATLNGLITIRALNAEEILNKEFKSHQDIYTSAQFLFANSARALGYYLEIFTLLFVMSLIFLLIFFSENIFVGEVGLIITQWFSLSMAMQYGVRQSTEVESHLTSVERILEYTDLDQEPFLESKTENKQNKNWPSNGRLEFKNVFLSYYPGGATVLKKLNFVISPREKIGIVGRTGAGKTSLIAALFRLAYVEGEIYIDDVETSRLGLDDLRSNISIIPQQPFLFTGSLRRNLDPFDEHSDGELWQALEDVELKDVLKDMESGLNMKIFDGGSNFSVGQRQLLSLARAILKNKKILVLDEATANVDLQTDELIQKTIRRRFKDCTVLIIAHRLNTVMDCDKFIVMDAGSMVEFDDPRSLLQNKDGYLYKMVQQTSELQ